MSQLRNGSRLVDNTPNVERSDRLCASMSVIIATKDRATVLNNMLRSLIDQTLAPDEVIVVDQSGTDETRKLVANVTALAQSQSTQFIYVHAPELRGAGAARNAGMALASFEIFVFLDDDVLLEPQFLREMATVYSDYPSVGGVSGIITNYGRPPLRQRLLDQYFCFGPFRDERFPLYWGANGLMNSAPIPIRKMTGCVMSVRRSALGVHRFDENYLGAGAEDVDLSWRISAVSPLVLAPRSRLKHLRTSSGPKREYWLVSAVTSQYYLYYRLWNTSIKNLLCFCWLNCGFIAVATASSLRQRSLIPFKALLRGIVRSRELLAAAAGETGK